MNCRELSEFIHDYLAGALPEGERATFERHLERCPDCVRYLDSYRTTIELARGAYAGEVIAPCQVPEGLIQAVLAAKRREGTSPR